MKFKVGQKVIHRTAGGEEFDCEILAEPKEGTTKWLCKLETGTYPINECYLVDPAAVEESEGQDVT